MDNLLKKIKVDSVLTAIVCTIVGVVLLCYPEITATILCSALGAVLILCGIADVLNFVFHRDGSLYYALHLIFAIILIAVGVYLLFDTRLVTTLIPRIVGAIICIHGISDFLDAFRVRKGDPARFKTVLILALITLALGAVLIARSFEVFQTAVRIIGAFLVYDGVSDLWISSQVTRAIRLLENKEQKKQEAIDVPFEPVSENDSEA